MTAISSASSMETAHLELANLEFISRDGHKQNFSGASSKNLPNIPHFCHEGTSGVLRVRNSPWQEQPEEEEGDGDSIQYG